MVDELFGNSERFRTGYAESISSGNPFRGRKCWSVPGFFADLEEILSRGDTTTVFEDPVFKDVMSEIYGYTGSSLDEYLAHLYGNKETTRKRNSGERERDFRYQETPWYEYFSQQRTGQHRTEQHRRAESQQEEPKQYQSDKYNDFVKQYNQDPYDALGVKRDTPPKEIKKIYRAAAREFHPDRNIGDKEAEENFKIASSAFDVIEDDLEKRGIKL